MQQVWVTRSLRLVQIRAVTLPVAALSSSSSQWEIVRRCWLLLTASIRLHCGRRNPSMERSHSKTLAADLTPQISLCSRCTGYTADWRSAMYSFICLNQDIHTVGGMDGYKYSSGYYSGQTREGKKLLSLMAGNWFGRPCGEWGYLFLAATAKDPGMTWTTNHNKAACQSQHHSMPVGHIRWQAGCCWWLHCRQSSHCRQCRLPTLSLGWCKPETVITKHSVLNWVNK